MSPYRKYRRTDPRRYQLHLRLLGRRGAALLVGGIMWILLGIRVIRHHAPVPGSWLLSHGWQVQAAAWIVAGIIAWWYAWRTDDAPGWWVGMYPMAAWVILVITEICLRAAIDHQWGALFDALDSGGINYGIVGWIVIMAGWREDRRPRRLPKGEPPWNR